MPFYHPDSKTEIQEGVAFTLNNIQYPANWLNLSSPQDKVDHGILELVTSPQPTFYPNTQEIAPGDITVSGNIAVKGWSLRNLTPDELTNKLRTATVDKLQEIESKYQDAISQPVTYNGHSFQADAASRSVLNDTLVSLAATQATPPGFFWVAADNTQVPVTYADLQALAGLMFAQGSVAFAKKQALKAAVRAATSATAVQAVIW